jgi:hypothetical protein
MRIACTGIETFAHDIGPGQRKGRVVDDPAPLSCAFRALRPYLIFSIFFEIDIEPNRTLQK